MCYKYVLLLFAAYYILQESEYPKLAAQSRSPYFIQGWIQYISAVEHLWIELRTAYGFGFLRTRNLSQDCLEHFFSIIRWKNSNNNHPDASKFASAYKAIVINQLVAPKKLGNVKADLSKYFVNTSQMAKIKLIPNEHRKNYKRSSNRTHIQENPTDISDSNQLSNIYYTTGWVCSKLSHRECIERSIADTSNESSFFMNLRRFKQNSRLNAPGKNMFKFCRKIVCIFEKSFDVLLKKSVYGVKRSILDTIFWPYQSSVAEKLIYGVLCVPCAKKVADKYLNMLVKAKLQNLNMEFKSSSLAHLKRKKTKRELTKRKKLNIK